MRKGRQKGAGDRFYGGVVVVLRIAELSRGEKHRARVVLNSDSVALDCVHCHRQVQKVLLQGIQKCYLAYDSA